MLLGFGSVCFFEGGGEEKELLLASCPPLRPRTPTSQVQTPPERPREQRGRRWSWSRGRGTGSNFLLAPDSVTACLSLSKPPAASKSLGHLLIHYRREGEGEKALPPLRCPQPEGSLAQAVKFPSGPVSPSLSLLPAQSSLSLALHPRLFLAKRA